MAKIISKRGERRAAPAAPTPAREFTITTHEIHIYDAHGGQHELTEDEIEHIRRVFDSIRKQLDLIH